MWTSQAVWGRWATRSWTGWLHSPLHLCLAFYTYHPELLNKTKILKASAWVSVAACLVVYILIISENN